MTPLFKKYQTYRDNILWHIETNKPTGAELERCEQRLADFNEVLRDLSTAPAIPASTEQGEGREDEAFEKFISSLQDAKDKFKDMNPDQLRDMVGILMQISAAYMMPLFYSLSCENGIEAAFVNDDNGDKFLLSFRKDGREIGSILTPTPSVSKSVEAKESGMRWVKASEIDIDFDREYIAKWRKEFVNNGRFLKQEHGTTFYFDSGKYAAVGNLEELFILVPAASSPLPSQGVEEAKGEGYWKKRCEAAEQLIAFLSTLNTVRPDSAYYKQWEESIRSTAPQTAEAYAQSEIDRLKGLIWVAYQKGEDSMIDSAFINDKGDEILYSQSELDRVKEQFKKTNNL